MMTMAAALSHPLRCGTHVQSSELVRAFGLVSGIVLLVAAIVGSIFLVAKPGIDYSGTSSEGMDLRQIVWAGWEETIA